MLLKGDSFNKTDKVLIVTENGEMFKGYIDSISEKYLILYEYVPNIYRTFNLSDILEITKI